MSNQFFFTRFNYEMKSVIALLFILLAVSIDGFAQARVVTGTVKNENGEVLSGVSVTQKNLPGGTVTDVNGKFSIQVQGNNSILVFSFVGYSTEEAAVPGSNEMQVVLQTAASRLGDVVVVGYGTQKKETLTGAVSSVKGSEVIKSPAINVSNSLAGRIPGVTVIGQGGEPGNDYSTILVRGLNTFQNSTPLFVVDGVPQQNSDKLQHIDPSSIENISVLKDASAAIYGSQGANGVILITTKRGRAGRMAVSASFNQGFGQPTALPKMMSSYQLAAWQNEAIDRGYATGTLTLHPGKYSVYELAGYAGSQDPWNYPNTDWVHEMIKPWAAQNYANVTVSGGSDKVRGLVSLSDRNQDGFFRNGSGKYKQYDLRTNLDMNPSRYVTASLDLNGRMDKSNFPVSDAGTIFEQTILAPPSRAAYWPNGLLGEPTDPTGQSGSPVAIGTPLAGYNTGDNYVLNGTAKVIVKIPGVDGLSVTGTGTLDRVFYFGKYWSKPVTYNEWDADSGIANPKFTQLVQGDLQRTLTVSQNRQNNYLVNFLANYDRRFGEHGIKLLLGYEQFERGSSTLAITRRGFDADNLDQLVFGSSANELINQDDPGLSRWQNYLGRINYDFKSKLLFEFLFRYQGSSIFSGRNQWGFFPGASIGYRLSDEKFWKDGLAFINNFKIRASWGRTGNDLVPPFQYLSLYQPGITSYVQQVGPSGALTEYSTLHESTAAYENATWETADQTDIGLDADFFNSKISLTFDYFRNVRKDILTPLSGGLPASTGIIPPNENIGRFLNRGFDFNLAYRNNDHAIKYGVSVNGLYAKNKYLYFDEVAGVPAYQEQTGHPIGAGMYYEAAGIFRTQKDLDKYPAAVNGQAPQLGDLIFRDVNGDGKIDQLDQVRSYKSSVPTFSGGLNINISYKAFDLSVLFQGAFGGAMYLRPSFSLNSNYLVSFYEDRWTPDNVNSTFPRFSSGSSAYWTDPNGIYNTFFLHNTDYVRLKNVEFGYTIPASVTGRLNIEQVRVYFNGMNLLTYCPGLKGWYTDPEEVVRSQFYGESYPLQRIVNFGINVNF
jgi:TonB-linked SusC/RagA family outer membrane protein